jgi:hypothetical protein
VAGKTYSVFGTAYCSITEGVEASGLSRSLLYQKMNAGELEWVKVGARRLLRVRSLLRLLRAE